MISKTKIISNGKLDKAGLKKIGKSLIITLIGAGIGFLADSMNYIDYGSYETILATFLPFLVNSLYKWLGTYEAKV